MQNFRETFKTCKRLFASAFQFVYGTFNGIPDKVSGKTD